MPLRSRPHTPIAVNLLTGALLLLGGLSFLGQGHVLLGVLSVVTGVGFLVLCYLIWRGPRLG